MNLELFNRFIEEYGDNPALIFKAWSSDVDPVINITFCHFCYESKKDTIPNQWGGIRIDKIQGIYIKNKSKVCQEHVCYL